jgi:hypothetical protein
VAAAGCAGEGSETTPTASEEPSTPTAATEDAVSVDGDTVTVSGGGKRTIAAGLRELEAQSGRTLRLEAGTYRLGDDISTHDHDVSYHFVAQGIEDGTIVGDDAEIVSTVPNMGCFFFSRCPNLTVSGLTIDYDPVPFSQGRIDEVNRGDDSIVVTLDEGYPALTHSLFDTSHQLWGTIHDPETELPLTGVNPNDGEVVRFGEFERVGDRRFRVGVNNWSALATGRKLVFNARQPGARPFQFNICDGMTLESTTVYASPNFVVGPKMSRSPTVRSLEVRRRPGTNRLISSNADGVHFSGCYDGPTMEGCYMELLEDDCIVMGAKLNEITEFVDDRTVAVSDIVGTHYAEGDTVEAMSPAGERLGELPPVESAEYHFSGLHTLGRPDTVTFAEPIRDTVSVGDYLSNRDMAGDGFVVRNNTLKNNRARPIRITCRDGVVENNTIDGCNSAAILMRTWIGGHFAPFPWAENVTIRNNTIADAGLQGVPLGDGGQGAIWLDTNMTEPLTGHPHRNITITGNEFERSRQKTLHASGAESVTFENNDVTDVKWSQYVVGLDTASDVSITGNTVTASDLRGFGWRRNASGVTTSDNTYTVGGSSKAPALVTRGSGGNGAGVYRVVQPTKSAAGQLTAATVEVRRRSADETTTYEVKIPWSALSADPDTEALGFSMLVNDNDGDGRTGWREWAGGIGENKDPAAFRRATLVTDGDGEGYPIRRHTPTIDGSIDADGLAEIDLDAEGEIVATGDTQPSGGGAHPTVPVQRVLER